MLYNCSIAFLVPPVARFPHVSRLSPACLPHIVSGMSPVYLPHVSTLLSLSSMSPTCLRHVSRLSPVSLTMSPVCFLTSRVCLPHVSSRLPSVSHTSPVCLLTSPVCLPQWWYSWRRSGEITWSPNERWTPPSATTSRPARPSRRWTPPYTPASGRRPCRSSRSVMVGGEGRRSAGVGCRGHGSRPGKDRLMLWSVVFITEYNGHSYQNRG